MDAARHRTWIIVEVVAIVVAVAVGAFLGVRARNSDDADQAASTLPAVVSSTTATPAPTTTIAPPTATTTPVLPPPTDNTDPTTTTIAPATTTTLPPLTTPTGELLAAVIPSADDLPGDWFAVPNSSPFPEFAPSAQVIGFCGGSKFEQRALDAGAVAAAWWNAGPPEPVLWRPMVVGFTSSDDAADFVEATRSQIAGCGGSYAEELPEGDGSPGTYDGYYDENPPVVWTIASTTTTTDPDIQGTDDALGIVSRTRFSTTRDGQERALTDSHVYQYERFGPIVVVNFIASAHDRVGFDFTDPPNYVPTEADASVPADLFRDLIVSRLEDQGLIHPTTD